MATSSSNVPKKWGSASKFQGRRGEFLELWVPAYCEASQKKLTVKLWDRVFPQYWVNFPWRSPLEEDVSRPLFVDTSENWESPVVEPENLTPEETQQKVTVVDATQKQIKTWFNHRQTAMGLSGNPWSSFMKQMTRPEGPAPKRIVDYQFYMQHPDFKEKVAQEYSENHSGTPKKDRLKVKCEIARTLLEAESEEVKARICAEAVAEHEALLEAHNKVFEGTPPATEEERELARERFSSVVAPLLTAMADYTGYKMTLLAGRVETDPKVDVPPLAVAVFNHCWL
ncbi:hypothetical protein B0H14DRAFT_3504463 [Mycena olivaceomarginata]|nr:hypothetical protein B0H14DRAFT_3504463 [Mycena olivaceomarginata]